MKTIFLLLALMAVTPPAFAQSRSSNNGYYEPVRLVYYSETERKGQPNLAVLLLLSALAAVAGFSLYKTFASTSAPVASPDSEHANHPRVLYQVDSEVVLSPDEQRTYGVAEQKFAAPHPISDLAIHEAGHTVAFAKVGAKVGRTWIRSDRGLPPTTLCTAPVADQFAMAVGYAAGGAAGVLFGTPMRESDEDRRLLEEAARKAGVHPDEARLEATRLLNDPNAAAALLGIATQLDRDGSMNYPEIAEHLREVGIV